ncbi:MAG: hypothetical protein K0S67_6 [Nitrososphaeraceae archaeon]|jgi:hypothetical protein|nr:hypothetical protein [Nitrososphaeraceae archaeon]
MSKIRSQFNTDVDSENTIKLRVSAGAAQTSTPWNFEAFYGNNAFLDTTKSMELVSCSITHTVPNVSADQNNNVFELTTTAGTFTHTFSNGFYSATNIGNILKPLLDAVITPSTSTFGFSDDGYFQITITGGAEIKNTVNNTLGNLLGYDTLNDFTDTLTADLLPKLNGISYFHIVSRKIGVNCYTNSVDGTNLGCCLFSIPVTVPFGFQNVFENSNNQERIRFNIQTSLKNFDISLYDENFRLLTDMDPRSIVELILKVIY